MTGVSEAAVRAAAAALHAHAVGHIHGATPLAQWDMATQRLWRQRARAALVAAAPYMTSSEDEK